MDGFRVSLAAIQGLQSELDEKEGRINRLDTMLERVLAELEFRRWVPECRTEFLRLRRMVELA